MNSRWYISILIITLTFLGSIARTQQVATPNQEIVLQFSSINVSTQDTQNAIANLKEQLEVAGVNEIQVQTLSDGQLKISYFSNADVESIKALLSNECDLDLGYVSKSDKQSHTPSEEKNIAYNFDVYEIQQGDDVSELDGKLALEVKAQDDRIYNPNVFASNQDVKIETKECIEKVAYKLSRTVSIATDNNSYKIPEVRAGPVI
ncbi:hypothetical protein WNY78_08870 [Psychroserpens sp. AS72]|uniref:hypothetical protein n=1 Tax=Psychroserpens sp. AS72 TaxID=3135775 RepID=UPI00316B75BE